MKKLFAEHCVPLRAFQLPVRGRARIAVDPAVAEGLGHPTGFGILCSPRALRLVFGGNCRGGQRIARKRLTHRYAVQCPQCGGWRRILYLPPGGREFRCSKCLNLTWMRKASSRYRREVEPPEWRWARLAAELLPEGEREVYLLWVEFEKAAEKLRAEMKKPGGFERVFPAAVTAFLALVGRASESGDGQARRVREQYMLLLYPLKGGSLNAQQQDATSASGA